MASDPSRSIWLRPERSGRGPVPEHDRTAIAAAAIAQADREGLDTVSMRRVAAVLGTGPASLYRYVDSRDELLELMADTAIGELDLTHPPSGAWRDDLVALARQQRNLYRRHRWLLDLFPGRLGLGPHTIGQLEYALAALATVDAPGPAKLEAIALMNGLVSLVARTEFAVGGSPTDWSTTQAEHLGTLATGDRHPHLIVALAEAAGTAPAARPDPLDRLLPRLISVLLGVQEPAAD